MALGTVNWNVTYPYSWANRAVRISDGVTVTNADTHSQLPLGTGTEGISRQSNPTFRDKIAKRQNATTPYFRSGYTGVKILPAVIRGINPSGDVRDVVTYHRVMSGVPGSVFDYESQALADAALNRLKRKLKKQVTSFDSLVPLLEIKDLRTTIKSIADLTTSALQTLIDIKKTRGRSALSYASKAWLTYGFGVRPMLADVDNLCKAIAGYLERDDRFVRLTGTAYRDWVSRSSTTNITSSYIASLSVGWHFKHYLSYRYVAGFNLPLKSANNYGWDDHLGTTFPDVLPALWEAAAFSWVADYFTNIGEYINDTLTSPPGNTTYVSVNTIYRLHGEGQSIHVPFSPVSQPGLKVYSNNPGNLAFDYFEFKRNTVTALPRQGLHFKSAEEVANYGISKVLNLASILGADKDTRRLARR